MPHEPTTREKCNRILNFYEELEPRSSCAKPISNSKESFIQHPYIPASKKKPSRYRAIPSKQLSSSAEKSSSHDFSFSKNCSFNTSVAKPKRSSYVSPYNRESRLDKIMRIKVKAVPAIPHIAKRQLGRKKELLNTSLGSLSSSCSLNKENVTGANRESRLERIMRIKIAKPLVTSTLHNYEPRQASRSASKQSRPSSAVKEWKECVERLRKQERQNEKEDRLWRVFERERELHMLAKKKQEDREMRSQRRKEKRFERMVEKEIGKIQREKQIIRHQPQGFSQIFNKR